MELREVFEPIVNFLKSLQKKEKDPASKEKAKERLQLVLMQDRASVSPDFFEMMKKEIIEVIKKYIEIDEEALEVQLTRGFEDGDDSGPALYANIPIKNIKPVAKKVEENEDEFIEEIETESPSTFENGMNAAPDNVEAMKEAASSDKGENVNVADSREDMEITREVEVASVEKMEEASKRDMEVSEQMLAEDASNVDAHHIVKKESSSSASENVEEISGETNDNFETMKDKLNEVKDGMAETIEKVKKGAKAGMKKIKTKTQKKIKE